MTTERVRIGMDASGEPSMTGYANAGVMVRVLGTATPAQLREMAQDLLAHAERIQKGAAK